MLPRVVSTALVLLAVGATAADAQSELVIYQEGSGVYHRAGCPVLKDATAIVAMTRAQAESRGHKPHAGCDPDRKKSEGTASPASPAPSPPVTVYLDDGRYYHRKDCSKLEPNPQKVRSESLEIAGKSHWPCPACRPPVRRKSVEPAVPGTGRRGR